MSFIPDGKSGNWEISTFTVEKNDLSQSISLWKYGRSVPGGTYKRLVRKDEQYSHRVNDTVVMSNTPDEIRDFIPFVNQAKGVILINGLGLGCLVKKLLEKDEVTELIVIEKSEDVINLVKPYFNDNRLTIINADAFEYTPPKGKKYDYIWHDIWDYICGDNLAEMNKLHKKYYGKVNGFQDSWAKLACQRFHKRDRAYSY